MQLNELWLREVKDQTRPHCPEHYGHLNALVAVTRTFINHIDPIVLQIFVPQGINLFRKWKCDHELDASEIQPEKSDDEANKLVIA